MGRKIIFYTHSLAGGGAERVWAQLAKGFRQRGEEIIFVQDFESGANASWLGESVHRVTLGKNHALAIWRLSRLIRREKPAYTLSALCVSNLKHTLAAILAGRSRRAILSYHGYFAAEPQLLSRISYILTPLLTRIAARTVCVSDAMRDYLVSVWRAPPTRTLRIYNPAAIDAEEGVKEPCLESRSPVIVSASRLIPGKNVVGLVRAFARVTALDARLILLGDGPERPRIEAEITRLGLQKRVFLKGFVERPWTIYRQARCFALFSNSESFGLVLVEAMACGLSIVSTDCGGTREVLAGGRYGRLIAIGDEAAFARALDETLAGPADAATQKSRARAFSLEVALDAYSSLFDDVSVFREKRCDLSIRHD